MIQTQSKSLDKVQQFDASDNWVFLKMSEKTL